MEDSIFLKEVFFKANSLNDCFRKAADWLDENKINEYNIRGAMVEQDSEYSDWYISIFLMEEPLVAG